MVIIETIIPYVIQKLYDLVLHKYPRETNIHIVPKIR